MRRVILESPYSGDVAVNVAYARSCLRDCLKRGEAPLASHILYAQTGVLDDAVTCERALGVAAGLAWYGSGVDACVAYVDHGVTSGMLEGMLAAQAAGVPIVLRKLSK